MLAKKTCIWKCKCKTKNDSESTQQVKGKSEPLIPKGRIKFPHPSGNFWFNSKVMMYQANPWHTGLLQACWDLPSELVGEQTCLNGHLLRSEVICSRFFGPWDLCLGRVILCVLINSDAQGSIGALRHSFKRKGNKSVGVGCLENTNPSHVPTAPTNSSSCWCVLYVLPVCVT